MRIARVLAAASLTLSLIAAGAPSAQADVDPPADGYGACEFTEGKFFDKYLTVGNTHERTIDFSLQSTDCGGFAVEGDDASSNPYVYFGYDIGGYLYSSDGDPSDIYGTVSAFPGLLYNGVAGKELPGKITLPDGTTRPFPGKGLIVKRKVMMDDVATPSPTVKKNKLFYVGSHIDRADWDTGEYTAYGKKKVRIEYRPSGGKWKTIKTVKSRALKYEGGEAVGKVKASKSGCLRLVSDATSTTASAMSDEVCVKVKK